MDRYAVQQKIKHTFLWVFNHIVLLINFTLVLLPLMWMIIASFSPGRLLSSVRMPFDLFRALFRFDFTAVAVEFDLFTSRLTLDQYRFLFTYRTTSEQALSDYWEAFGTSLYIALLNTVLVVILSSLVGFAFSRFKFIGKKRVLLTFMGLQLFPAFMGMIALFLLFRQFGLLNNPTALSLIYVTGAIPYNTFIIRGYMRNIPKSLDEAAAIDGANNFQILTQIIIPLAVPIMGFVAVNAFMAPWMDYILPSVIMPQVNTLAVWLFRFSNPTGNNYSPLAFMSGALFISIPIMIVQMYMQRFVVYGLTAGADKG